MYYRLGMDKTSDICDALGRKEMGQRLGVSRAAIANAVTDGRFPSRWYKVISRMCEESNRDCPMQLFNFADESLSGEDAA
jgi:hypothetical protein